MVALGERAHEIENDEVKVVTVVHVYEALKGGGMMTALELGPTFMDVLACE